MPEISGKLPRYLIRHVAEPHVASDSLNVAQTGITIAPDKDRYRFISFTLRATGCFHRCLQLGIGDYLSNTLPNFIRAVLSVVLI